MFKTILKFALKDFNRNRGMAIASIFVLTLTTMLVTGLLFSNAVSGYLVSTVKNKIDITAYFKETAMEQEILDAKTKLQEDVPTIKNINYVSREQALENFNAIHSRDEKISQALLEVGDNPFWASLNINTDGNIDEYQKIADILDQPKFSNLIEKVNFLENRTTIEKILKTTKVINMFILTMSFVLFIFATLIVFNTIKLVINNSKEEIHTMKIVGASKSFIKAPYIVQGALFGIISFAVCFIATFVFIAIMSPIMVFATPGFSLLGYWGSHWVLIALAQFLTAVGLGVLTSFLAIRKYLNN